MRTKRKTWTFPTHCKQGHPYEPNPPLDYRGSRICIRCRAGGLRLCKQCNLRPVKRKTSIFCSLACNNASRARPLSERFEQYWTPGEPESCWLWTGTIHHGGYGVIGDEHQRQIQAHRIAYERVYGPVPEGKNVCHHCDNPPCVNPSHLFIGTVADNNEDKRRKKRHPHGESHPTAKLTTADVRAIRARYAQEGGGNEIAADYGVTRGTIYDIVQRRSWTHID